MEEIVYEMFRKVSERRYFRSKTRYGVRIKEDSVLKVQIISSNIKDLAERCAQSSYPVGPGTEITGSSSSIYVRVCISPDKGCSYIPIAREDHLDGSITLDEVRKFLEEYTLQMQRVH